MLTQRVSKVPMERVVFRSAKYAIKKGTHRVCNGCPFVISLLTGKDS